MAEIRTEQKKQNTWVWIMLAVVLIVAVLAALVWAGYIVLPGGATATSAPPVEGGLAAIYAALKREG